MPERSLSRCRQSRGRRSAATAVAQPRGARARRSGSGQPAGRAGRRRPRRRIAGRRPGRGANRRPTPMFQPPPADPNAPQPAGSTTRSADSATSFPRDGSNPTRPTWTTVRRCSARFPVRRRPGQPPPVANDTRVVLGKLDQKLYASAEADNAKAAARLASDMGEFFMPYPGTRVNQETIPLGANGAAGGASYYEVKFSDATKPNGQIWAGVITPPGRARPRRISAGLWCGWAPATTRSTRQVRKRWPSRSDHWPRLRARPPPREHQGPPRPPPREHRPRLLPREHQPAVRPRRGPPPARPPAPGRPAPAGPRSAAGTPASPGQPAGGNGPAPAPGTVST